MLEIIAVSIVALALTIVFKSYTSDQSKLTGSRAPMLTMGVQIICGDCSGDDLLPRKTLLERNGTCGRCGGRSYVLASNRITQAQQAMMQRLMELDAVPERFTLQAIEPPVTSTQIDSVTALEGWSLVT